MTTTSRMQIGSYSKLLFVLMLLFTLAFTSSVKAEEEDVDLLEERAFKKAVALASQSIVRIQTVGGLDKVGRVLLGTGPTTGVVVSKDGYIISSAFNFVSKPASILVELPGNKRVTAKLIANDKSRMLALLKIEAKNLIPIKAAEQKKFEVGQWTIAVGRTFDKEIPSMSLGILSAVNRIWGKAIQTDCKVSPVNYGGPLLDIEGNAMGILVPLSTRGKGETAGVEWYDSGIGFAVPMEDVYASLERLKTGKDLLPGLMGINFKSRDQLGGKPVIGVVRPESPADKAGFKTGDLIVEADGKKVYRLADVKHVLGRKYADDIISVSVTRKGKTITQKIKLVGKLIPHEAGFLGILPTRESSTDAVVAGVGVRFIYPNSPAEKAGLKLKDRITSLNGVEITSAAQLSLIINKIRPDAKVALEYQRGETKKKIEVQLAHITKEIPVDLLSVAIPATRKEDKEKEDAKEGDDKEADEKEAGDKKTKGPQKGRFNGKLPNGEHSYWAFVPEYYNPDYQYGLMVWLHPTNDTMEATMIKKWKQLCNSRGIIIVAPRATKLSGWSPTDAEFVKETVEEIQKEYSVDPQRVFLHGYAKGGTFAYHVAFKYRELFRGVCVVDSPIRQRAAVNDSDIPLQFYILANDKEKLFKNIQGTIKGLEALKYPVTKQIFKESETAYPYDEAVDGMAMWADCLDRI